MVATGRYLARSATFVQLPRMTDDPNAHVHQYLAHYLNFPHAPHFAVLLAGPWGIGKTHLLRTYLSDAMAGRTVAYVSLFGMRRREDIEEALFAALYPRATGKAARIAGGVAKALLKHAKYEIDFDKSDVLDRFAADLYVFDDLERCEMSVNIALGYINEFVEHDGCKVVIVANIGEIAENDRKEFNRRREKIIGKVLEVRSAFGAAYSWFCSKIDDERTKVFLLEEAAEVATLYDQSGLQNLRILQQTMWDFERVYECLEDRHRSRRPGLVTLLRLFFSLSFEVKAGRLTAEDLENRIHGVMVGEINDQTPSRIRVANDRYASLELYEPILNDDVLRDLLIAGIVDPESIRSSLDQTAWFSNGAEPAWRVVWGAYERPDVEVEVAVQEMEAQFQAHAFTIGGEILHVVGLQLHLSDIGVLDLDRKETIVRAKKYIDETRALGTLEVPQAVWKDDLRYGGYGGLGITQIDTPEMGEIYAYLSVARAGAATDSYPAKAVTLLDEMRRDHELFIRRVTQNESPDSLYAFAPVLAAVEPSDFAAAFLELSSLSQRSVSQGLLWRYEHVRLIRELAAERDWVQNVRDCIATFADAAQPIPRNRLRTTILWSLDKLLANSSVAASAEGNSENG